MLTGRHSARNNRPGKDGPATAASTARPRPQPAVTTAGSYLPSPRHASRACCCPAQPAVVAILPPAPDRPGPAELLLCCRHYRACRDALAARDALILTVAGCPLPDGDWPGAA